MAAIRSKYTYVFIIIFLLSGMFSCSKKDKMNDEGMNDENVETALIDENEITETDEDLLNVDYREFYDELSPHGEWIEVTDKDIDAVMNPGTSYKEGHKVISFSELFGVKDAHAVTAAFGAFFVWRPSPEIAVSIAAGEPEPVYVPYTNGRWIHTDAGWYFLAATDYEEITHHHGRWVYSPAMGWVWVPGRVWAPAWVDWREDDTYLAWEPLPPSIYIINNVVVTPPIYEERYIFVERRHFCMPEVYNYVYTYKTHGHHVKIREMRRLDGIMVVNNTVINRGPDVTVIGNLQGTKIEMVKVNKVKHKGDFKFTGNEVYSYSPQFSKVKTDKNRSGAYYKPEKFNKYNDFKSGIEKNKDYSGNDKNKTGSDNKFDEKRRYSDDRDMKNGRNSGNDIKENNKKRKDSKRNDGSYKDNNKNKQNERNGKNNDGYKKDNSRKKNNDGKIEKKNNGKNNSNGDKIKGRDNGKKDNSNGNIEKKNKGKNNNYGDKIKGKDNGRKENKKFDNKNYDRSKGNGPEKRNDSKPQREKQVKENNKQKGKRK